MGFIQSPKMYLSQTDQKISSSIQIQIGKRCRIELSFHFNCNLTLLHCRICATASPKSNVRSTLCTAPFLVEEAPQSGTRPASCSSIWQRIHQSRLESRPGITWTWICVTGSRLRSNGSTGRSWTSCAMKSEETSSTRITQKPNMLVEVKLLRD